MCTFCQKVPETIVHLFVECDHVKDLWIKLEEFIKEYSPDTIDFCIDKILFSQLVERPLHIINFMCLAAKHYIYKKKCFMTKSSFKEFKIEIKNCEKYEKYYAIMNDKLEKHYPKWYSKSENINTTQENISVNYLMSLI